MSNHLSKEHSPYLQEHANNPVDWFAWNDKTLALAKTLNKPILLSIGYSACHWCHVMAYESFEDVETAKLMNQLFINIKVDREERPDLDKIFQLAHQLITQRPGGWPLTIFLTPDEHMPFFAGTYFPKEAPVGAVNFKQVLEHVASAFHEKKDDIAALTKEMKRAFSQLSKIQYNEHIQFDDTPIQKSFVQLKEDFDDQFGGFGDAPKFPHPIQCYHLLQHLTHTNNRNLLEKTLDHMALGGIFDQLAGGFFRYTVDRAWEIPHFEKMLYDSALLLPVYAQAHQVFQKPLYKKVALMTANWLKLVMQAENGGFYSTLNADSEGIEGLFYLWDKSEIQNLLDDTVFNHVSHYFNLNEKPNVENKWHLHITKAELFDDNIQTACQRLLEARRLRIPPSKDDKMLCSWNALAIKGLAIVGHLFENPQCVDAAEKALHFLLENFYDKGKLAAICKDQYVYLSGYLDDYAFLLDALLTLLELRWSNALLNAAIELANTMCEQFLDQDSGAFYFTGKTQETVIERQKILLDDAMPAGNSIANACLIRLGYLLADQTKIDIATKNLKATWEYLTTYPAAHCSLLNPLQMLLAPPTLLWIVGPDANTWQKAYQKKYQANTFCFAIDNEADCPVHLKSDFKSDTTFAITCQGMQCQQKYDSLTLFLEGLAF